jgi:hypothetical protein
MDWKNVELSLVTGRPVSFIQNLYPPLLLDRPVLPLAIAGIADAQTYDSGYRSEETKRAEQYEESSPAPVMALSKAMGNYDSVPERKNPSSNPVESTVAKTAGDQFEFTIKTPVTLERQQSAMIPLVDATVKAEKVSVFSGQKAESGGMIHPMLCVSLVNSAGMKLPAGPVTVFDGGTYAGDALMEFFPENEKRLIAYGEDLSVFGSVSRTSSRETTAVTVTKGIMTISRQNILSRVYTFKNADSHNKNMILEQPVTQDVVLTLPKTYLEKTDSLYRFAFLLPANSEYKMEVREQNPTNETVSLAQFELDTFVYYSSNREIPQKIKSALEKAAEFKKKADGTKYDLTSLEIRKNEIVLEQERIRKNLQAAGHETQQGKEYLKKLAQTDTEIDALSLKIETTRILMENTQKEYENYVSNLTV